MGLSQWSLLTNQTYIMTMKHILLILTLVSVLSFPHVAQSQWIVTDPGNLVKQATKIKLIKDLITTGTQIKDVAEEAAREIRAIRADYDRLNRVLSDKTYMRTPSIAMVNRTLDLSLPEGGIHHHMSGEAFASAFPLTHRDKPIATKKNHFKMRNQGLRQNVEGVLRTIREYESSIAKASDALLDLEQQLGQARSLEEIRMISSSIKVIHSEQAEMRRLAHIHKTRLMALRHSERLSDQNVAIEAYEQSALLLNSLSN